jgi:hypothetical protein
VRERKGEVDCCPFGERKNENFLDPQSIHLEPSESLNTGLFNLFPSHVCGAGEWQGTLASKSAVPLRAPHPPQHGFFFFDGMLILNVDPTIKTSQLL